MHVIGSLAEMGPTPHVQRDDPSRVEKASRCGSIRAGQRQRRAIEQGGTGGACEEQRNIDRPDAVGDVLNDLKRGVVAADIHRGQAASTQDEPSDLAG